MSPRRPATPNETRPVNFDPPAAPLGGSLLSTRSLDLNALRRKTAVPGLRFTMLTSTPRDNWLAFNREVLPEMHRFAAVDGTSRIAVMRALNESGLRFHKLHSNSLGALACWLTKFNALREQVSRRIPYQVILEDDLMVRDTFRGFAGHLVRTLFEERTVAHRVDVVALGRWGEGYLTSLASAERVVSRLLLNGVQKSIDIQLNDGSSGPVVQLHPNYVPFSYFRPPNKGLIGTTKRLPSSIAVPHPCADYMPLSVCEARNWASGNCSAFRERAGEREASRRQRLHSWVWLTQLYCSVSCGHPRPNCSRSALCPPAQAGREERVRIAESNVWCG